MRREPIASYPCCPKAPQHGGKNRLGGDTPTESLQPLAKLGCQDGGGCTRRRLYLPEVLGEALCCNDPGVLTDTWGSRGVSRVGESAGSSSNRLK